MAINRQPDLFLPDPEPELLEDRAEHVYRADPDEVRRDLMRLLAQVRTAEIMPWEPRKVRLYRARLGSESHSWRAVRAAPCARVALHRSA